MDTTDVTDTTNNILSSCFLLKHYPKTDKLSFQKSYTTPTPFALSTGLSRLSLRHQHKFQAFQRLTQQQSISAPIFLQNAKRSVTLFSTEGVALQNSYPIHRFLFARPSAFGLPYLVSCVIETTYIASLHTNPYSLLIPIHDCLQGKPTPEVIVNTVADILNSLVTPTDIENLSTDPKIYKTPWNFFCESPYMKHLVRGNLDTKPVLRPFSSGWAELQSLCLGHVPALIQLLMGKKYSPFAYELLHDSLDRVYLEVLAKYPVMKTLILMYLASKFSPSFATDPPDILAWKYGFHWFPHDWTPGTPLSPAWIYLVNRYRAHDATERLSQLTAPGLSCYTEPAIYGLMAAIETLRQFFLQDCPPSWVVLNLLHLGVGKSFKDWDDIA